MKSDNLTEEYVKYPYEAFPNSDSEYEAEEE